MLIRYRSQLKNEAVLAFVWGIGILAGSATAARLPEPTFLLMRGTIFGDTSIVGLAIAAFFPFFLSILFLKLSKNRLLFLLAFVKAFTYAFTLAVVKLLFGGAGWLVTLLALFSDSCITQVLLLFWFQNISNQGDFKAYSCLFPAIVIFSVILIDLCLISPFFHSLSYS